MKKTLLLVLQLLGIHSVHWAQPYFRLPPHGAVWQYEESGEVPPAPAWNDCFLKYTAGLDTILGYPVIVLKDSAGYDHLAVGQEYIYEDSTGKGYLISTGFFNPVPELVWDYGATVGQMIQGSQGLSYVVDSIDTVTYSDNVARKRLYATCYGCGGIDVLTGVTAIWVEGIGDILNGPTPRVRFETSSSCICYAEHGDVLTLGSTPWQCQATCAPYVGTTDALPLRLEAYPQPAQGSIHLRSDGSRLEVRLLGMDGRHLAAWQLPATRVHALDLPEVVPGLYLLEARDELGRMVTRRVMLE